MENVKIKQTQNVGDYSMETIFEAEDIDHSDKDFIKWLLGERMEKQVTKERNERAKRILLRLHEVGGCHAQDDFSKGWDEAITEAIRIVEAETGLGIGQVLD